MNILITARWPVGGIKTYIRYIYSQPAFEDIHLTLIAPDFGLTEYLNRYLPPNRIHYIACDDSSTKLMETLRNELSKNTYNLIHSHGFTAGILVYFATIFCRTPHLLTAHDVFRNVQFKGFKGQLKKFFLNLILSRIDCINTVGTDAYENYLQHMSFTRTNKVINIDNGVPTQKFFEATPRDFRLELKEPTRPIIAFFGRFMSQKGFIDIIKAMQILKDKTPQHERPIVLTFGYGGFIREDFELIKSLNLEDCFVNLPSTDDMPSAIKGVDLVLMPSRWEACPLLAMEVLSTGTPLIASDCIGLKGVTENTPSIRIPIERPDLLAEAILLALKKGRQPFEDYKKTASIRYDIERPANSLAKLYREFKAD